MRNRKCLLKVVYCCVNYLAEHVFSSVTFYWPDVSPLLFSQLHVAVKPGWYGSSGTGLDGVSVSCSRRRSHSLAVCHQILVYNLRTRRIDNIPMLRSAAAPAELTGGVYALSLNPSRSLLATSARNCLDLAVYRLPTLDPVCVGEVRRTTGRDTDRDRRALRYRWDWEGLRYSGGWGAKAQRATGRELRYKDGWGWGAKLRKGQRVGWGTEMDGNWDGTRAVKTLGFCYFNLTLAR